MAVKTLGVKEPCSISNTRWLYWRHHYPAGRASSTSGFQRRLSYQLRVNLLESNRVHSSEGTFPSGCFCFRRFKILSSSGRITFCMLSVKSLIAPLMLPFDIFSMNRFEISLVFIVFWEELGWFWIVSPSGSRYFISPRCQRSIHRELRGGLWILRCEMVSATGVLTLP